VKEALIGMLLWPMMLLAQQSGPAWTNIGPSPAAVQAIAVDPGGAGTIFMGSIAGGVQKSIDGGTTWSAVNNGLTTPLVAALAIDASGPQTVYAGRDGLFKTDDGGATWRNLPITNSVTSIATDPKRPGVVYVGAFNNLSNGAIRKSTDGGSTWTTVFNTTAAVFKITIDPAEPDTVYLPTIGHGASKSTDGGQNWTSMSSLSAAAIWTIAIDPTDSKVLYAGTNEDGVWTSTDAGTTWRHVGSPGPFPVYSISVAASAPQTIYAGTNGGGVWTSSDGGATWQPSGLSSGMVFSLAIDAAGRIYAGTNGAGAQVSYDRGATWAVLNTGLERSNKSGYGVWIDPNGGQNIFVSSESPIGLVASRNAGASWSIADGFTGMSSRGVAFDPTDSRRVYAGALVGSVLFKSVDGGATWSRRRFGTPAVYVIAVAVDALSPNIVYAGTGDNEGLFKSTDYGDTWASVGTGLSGAITFLTIDPTKSGRLFASTGMAFFLSEDGGQTWTNVLSMPAWTVTIDPVSPLKTYATTRTQGVFRSSDGGHTWQSINSGLTNLSMGPSAPVIIDPTNHETLYVGSGGGVFKSLDGGDHWFPVNLGLTVLSVSGLAMDPVNSSVLYASGASGVFKTVCGIDVTSQFKITSGGFRFNNGAQQFMQTVALQQLTLTPIQLPLSLVLDNLSSNAALANKTGTTSCAAPLGSPYINIPTGASSVVLDFVDPSNTGITYKSRILMGTGTR